MSLATDLSLTTLLLEMVSGGIVNLLMVLVSFFELGFVFMIACSLSSNYFAIADLLCG